MNRSVKKGQSPRETALIIMHQVSEKCAYANLELNKVLSRKDLSPLDRSFITELVYGAIRMQGTIDYILGLYIKKPLTSLPIWILLILRMGVYQIMFLDKVPDRAAVNESVNLAKKYGHAGTVKFVNGVLRNVSRGKENIKYPSIEEDPVGHIASHYSHPRWMVECWIKEFGLEETINLCSWNNTSPQVTIRTNTLKITRDELMRRLEKEGVKTSPGRYLPESIILEGIVSLSSLPSYQEGLFQVQDEGSMMVTHVLSPKPGSKMIDTCAAPGGKTTHAAELMENQGEIKAFDIHPHKLALIEESCKRLGINIVEARAEDAIKLPDTLEQWADFCLVDAPCSGLGVLRRRPDARWKKEATDILQLVEIQKKILSSAAKTLRPGGVLVYSTCTVTKEENQSMVNWFLGNHPDFSLERIPDVAVRSVGTGFSSGELPFDEASLQSGMVQLLPHLHGTDGLFMARMRRKE